MFWKQSKINSHKYITVWKEVVYSVIPLWGILNGWTSMEISMLHIKQEQIDSVQKAMSHCQPILMLPSIIFTIQLFRCTWFDHEQLHPLAGCTKQCKQRDRTPQTSVYTYIVARGPKPRKSVFFRKLFYFIFIFQPANAHILSNAFSSTLIRNGVRSKKVKHVCRQILYAKPRKSYFCGEIEGLSRCLLTSTGYIL